MLLFCDTTEGLGKTAQVQADMFRQSKLHWRFVESADLDKNSLFQLRPRVYRCNLKSCPGFHVHSNFARPKEFDIKFYWRAQSKSWRRFDFKIQFSQIFYLWKKTITDRLLSETDASSTSSTYWKDTCPAHIWHARHGEDPLVQINYRFMIFYMTSVSRTSQVRDYHHSTVIRQIIRVGMKKLSLMLAFLRLYFVDF
jgi:hypothetical protein